MKFATGLSLCKKLADSHRCVAGSSAEQPDNLFLNSGAEAELWHQGQAENRAGTRSAAAGDGRKTPFIVIPCPTAV